MRDKEAIKIFGAVVLAALISWAVCQNYIISTIKVEPYKDRVHVIVRVCGNWFEYPVVKEIEQP